MSESFIGNALSAETGGRAVNSAPAHDERNESAKAAINSPNAAAGSTPLQAQSKAGSLNASRGSKGRRKSKRSSQKTKRHQALSAIKQRFGLPDGFVPRWGRFERSKLLEENIYRLPNGNEYVPCQPSGTLGTHEHVYALLTVEQFLNNHRGSVYIRTDGRIFDYGVDSHLPDIDLFDTGYTIYDLERTGRYAPSANSGRKKRATAKLRKEPAAGNSHGR